MQEPVKDINDDLSIEAEESKISKETSAKAKPAKLSDGQKTEEKLLDMQLNLQ